VKQEKTGKVPLELTEKSLAFVKKETKRESVPSQRMIRGLIDAYAGRYEDNLPA
jgi:predicted DNA binding CopG/RHH family protein